MKPTKLSDKLPPGLTAFERMRELTRRVVSVARDEAIKREKTSGKSRGKKK